MTVGAGMLGMLVGGVGGEQLLGRAAGVELVHARDDRGQHRKDEELVVENGAIMKPTLIISEPVEVDPSDHLLLAAAQSDADICLEGITDSRLTPPKVAHIPAVGDASVDDRHLPSLFFLPRRELELRRHGGGGCPPHALGEPFVEGNRSAGVEIVLEPLPVIGRSRHPLPFVLVVVDGEPVEGLRTPPLDDHDLDARAVATTEANRRLDPPVVVELERVARLHLENRFHVLAGHDSSFLDPIILSVS